MLGGSGSFAAKPTGDRDERVENGLEVARLTAAHALFLGHGKLGRVIGPAAEDLDLLGSIQAWIARDILWSKEGGAGVEEELVKITSIERDNWHDEFLCLPAVARRRGLLGDRLRPSGRPLRAVLEDWGDDSMDKQVVKNDRFVVDLVARGVDERKTPSARRFAKLIQRSGVAG